MITDKCNKCGSALSKGHNGLYYYCADHPIDSMIYDDKEWNKYIKVERQREYEALKKLHFFDKIEN